MALLLSFNLVDLLLLIHVMFCTCNIWYTHSIAEHFTVMVLLFFRWLSVFDRSLMIVDNDSRDIMTVGIEQTNVGR